MPGTLTEASAFCFILIMHSKYNILSGETLYASTLATALARGIMFWGRPPSRPSHPWESNISGAARREFFNSGTNVSCMNWLDLGSQRSVKGQTRNQRQWKKKQLVKTTKHFSPVRDFMWVLNAWRKLYAVFISIERFNIKKVKVTVTLLNMILQTST